MAIKTSNGRINPKDSLKSLRDVIAGGSRNSNSPHR